MISFSCSLSKNLTSSVIGKPGSESALKKAAGSGSAMGSQILIGTRVTKENGTTHTKHVDEFAVKEGGKQW